MFLKQKRLDKIKLIRNKTREETNTKMQEPKSFKKDLKWKIDLIHKQYNRCKNIRIFNHKYFIFPNLNKRKKLIFFEYYLSSNDLLFYKK